MNSCPVCAKSFPNEELERHVNRCLDGGGDDAAPDIDLTVK